MQYHRIPHSSLEISTLGLGTMTFGEQNSEADAHQQLDYAVANGINLIDVAEMYPVPPRPETQGLTETYVGNWLAKRGNREKLVLASKVSGPARNNDSSIRPNHVLGPQKYPRGAARQPEAAADRLSRFISGSLAAAANQLLWQAGLYWADAAPAVTLLDTLEALTEFQRAGKIRYIGVSNETAFGVMRYLHRRISTTSRGS